LRQRYRKTAGKGGAQNQQADMQRFHRYSLDAKPIDAKMFL
jgi:hypothetical protein